MAKINQSMIELAYNLALNGLNDSQIYQSLGICKSSFYTNSNLLNIIKKARGELRQSVAKALLEKASEKDITSLIFLSKRLNLFSNEVEIDLSSPKTALKSFQSIVNADTSPEHKIALKSIIESYLRGYEVANLEERIEALENEKLKN